MLTIVRVSVEQKIFDPDAVDAQIYCINTSGLDILVSTSNESFITIDEETGATANDNSSERFILKPGEVRLISEIAGWEWDGHVGMKISYAPVVGGKSVSKSYNFKSASGNYRIDSLNLKGRVIPAV